MIRAVLCLTLFIYLSYILAEHSYMFGRCHMVIGFIAECSSDTSTHPATSNYVATTDINLTPTVGTSFTTFACNYQSCTEAVYK